MSEEFVRVAGVAEVAPGSALAVVVEGRDVALFHLDGAYYAVDNACPHQGGPLCEGWTDGAAVTCPWHAWTFDLRTGTLADDDVPMLERFEVRVEGDDVMVGRTPLPPAP